MNVTDQFTTCIDRYPSLCYPGGVRPAYEGGSIINMVQSLRACFGLPAEAPLIEHAAFLNALGGRRKVVMLILDGLGWINAESAMRRRPVLRDLLSPARRFALTTVFPSTTSAALTSLMTASPPAMHGVLGFIMAFPEYGRVFNMLSFRAPDGDHESLQQFGFDPDGFLPMPTMLQGLQAHGVFAGGFTFNPYAESGLSHLLYHGQAPYVYGGVGDLVTAMRDLLSMPGPLFLNLYWSRPDNVAHVYGADSDAYAIELVSLLQVLREEWAPFRDDTALIVTADHGHIDGDDAEAISLDALPGVAEAFRLPPAGEGRSQHLFLRPERVDAVYDILVEDGRMTVLRKDEVLALQLLGEPLRPGWEERLGDLLVLPHGTRRTLIDYQHRPHTAMRGRHGGLSPEEMVVPAFVL